MSKRTVARGSMSGLGRAACALVAIAIILSGFNASAIPRDGDTVLRCAIRPSFETNPLVAEQDSWKVLGLIYEGATERHAETGEIIPYIAVGSANASSDTSRISWNDCVVGNFGYSPRKAWADPSRPEIIIFYDFEGVKWHDGVQMSIRDIMFSFQVHARDQYEALGDPLKDKSGKLEGNYSETHWLHIHKVWESQDGSRAALKFVLQSPFYSVFEHYLGLYILPYHIWGNRISRQFVNNALIWSDPGYDRSEVNTWKSWMAERWANAEPVGSGRFRWAGQDKKGITLVPWDGHFYKPGFKYFSAGNGLPGAPSLNRIELLKYITDSGAIMDLESGKLDYIVWDMGRAAASSFANNPDVAAVSLSGTEMRYLMFNMGRESFGYVTDNAHLAPVLRDAGKHLRKAVVHCTDFQMVNYGRGHANTFFDWSNSSAPSYSFDPSEAINILMKSGYMLTNTTDPPGDGNWWLNPDGSPMGRTLSGVIEVLIDEDDYLMTFSIASVMVGQLRAAGINAQLLPLHRDILEQRVLLSDFDMSILGRDFPAMERNRPENFLFSQFHTANIIEGTNFIGYRNSSFDRHVEAAMSAPSRGAESRFVQDALAALAFDLPYFGLYYPGSVEVYRADRFFGFMDDGSGTLLNPLSLSSIKKETRQALVARFLNMPLTMLANTTLQLRIRVTDTAGIPVQGAEVRLNCTSGNLSAFTGLTDSQGLFRTNFTAPPVPESQRNGTSVMVSLVSAVKAGYRDARERHGSVAVFPEDAMLLSVTASAVQDVVDARDSSGIPGFTYIDILVTDEKNMPVADASVIIELEGLAMVPDIRAGLTDADGKLRFTLTAPDNSGAGECTVNITASKVAHVSGGAQVSIMVVPPREVAAPEQTGDTVWAYAGVPAAILLACAVYLWRRKR